MQALEKLMVAGDSAAVAAATATRHGSRHGGRRGAPDRRRGGFGSLHSLELLISKQLANGVSEKIPIQNPENARKRTKTFKNARKRPKRPRRPKSPRTSENFQVGVMRRQF